MIERTDSPSWEAIFNFPFQHRGFDEPRPFFGHPGACHEEFTNQLLSGIAEIAGMAQMGRCDLDEERDYGLVRRSVDEISELLDILRIGLKEADQRRSES